MERVSVILYSVLYFILNFLHLKRALWNLRIILSSNGIFQLTWVFHPIAELPGWKCSGLYFTSLFSSCSIFPSQAMSNITEYLLIILINFCVDCGHMSAVPHQITDSCERFIWGGKYDFYILETKAGGLAGSWRYNGGVFSPTQIPSHHPPPTNNPNLGHLSIQATIPLACAYCDQTTAGNVIILNGSIFD